MAKPNKETAPEGGATVETREIEPMLIRALVTPNSYDEKDRSVEVVAATEAPYKRYSWRMDEDYNEVLSMKSEHVKLERLNAGAPLLDSHNRWDLNDVIGVVVSGTARIEDGKLVARVRFSSRENAKAIEQDVRDGIITNISIGYRVNKFLREGAPEGELPTYRAVDWEPSEISFVPVPADYLAGVRSAKPDDNTKTNPVIIEMAADGKGSKPAAERRNMQENPTPENKPANTPAAPTAEEVSRAAQAAVEAERTRTLEIREAVRKAGLAPEFGDSFIKDGKTADVARAAIIDELAKNAPQINGGSRGVEVTADERDKQRGIIIDGMVLRSGEAGREKLSPERMREAAKYQGMSLLRMAMLSLQNEGVDIRGMSDMEIAGRAITSNSGDFPVLLEGTARRVLLANYEAVADTWRRFCAVGSVTDFREHKRLRMGSFSRLDKVGENAEYKNKKISDAESEKIIAETFGNIINVTRKMIINDDLAGFTRLASMLGRAAARSIEIDVYALLAANPTMGDGTALFHSDHGNIGTGSALTVTGLDADRVLMAQQKDPDGNDFLDIRPSVLLVPIGLEGTAKILNQSQYDPDATNKLQRPNIVAGLFSDVVSTARLTGTTRYLFADPAVEPVLEVAFLNGVQSPYMESEEAFNVDGRSWKIRLDYGVGAIGWRGVVRNAGTT